MKLLNNKQRAFHLCIDMQKLFSSIGPWATPWLEKVLPKVTKISLHSPDQTVFTRFIPPHASDDMTGAWQKYYGHWQSVTRRHLDTRLLELMPPLHALVPPAYQIDKQIFSAFSNPDLHNLLKDHTIDTLIVSGTETDCCILATVLDAVDLGYYVIIIKDAVCSASDESHDNILKLYQQRFRFHITCMTTEEVINAWQDC